MQHPPAANPSAALLFSEQLFPVGYDERFSQPLVNV
jgi:hypothetical protein